MLAGFRLAGLHALPVGELVARRRVTDQRLGVARRLALLVDLLVVAHRRLLLSGRLSSARAMPVRSPAFARSASPAPWLKTAQAHPIIGASVLRQANNSQELPCPRIARREVRWSCSDSGSRSR